MIASKLRYILVIFLSLFAVLVQARTGYNCNTLNDAQVDKLPEMHLETPMAAEMPSTDYQTAFKFEEKTFKLGVNLIYLLEVESVEDGLSKYNDAEVNLVNLNFENLPKSECLNILLGNKYKYLGKEPSLTKGIYQDRKADNWKFALTKQSYTKKDAKLSWDVYLFKEPEIFDKGKLTFINRSDIKSVRVFKDAAAMSIYESSARNGAILITTKKGKERKLNSNLNFNFDLVKWHQIPDSLKQTTVNLNWTKSNSTFNLNKLKVEYRDYLFKLSGNSNHIPSQRRLNNYYRALANYSNNTLSDLASKTKFHFNRELIRRRTISYEFNTANYSLDKNWHKKKRKNLLCNNYIAFREQKFKSFSVKNAYLISPVKRT